MKKLICCMVVLSVLLMSGSSEALEVNNASFEDFVIVDYGGNPAPPAGTVLEIWNGFDAADGAKSGWWDPVAGVNYSYPSAEVPGWENNANWDSGTKLGGTDGALKAWLGDGQEMWNLTSNVISAGESYTLTVDALNDWTKDPALPVMRMALYYDDAGTRVDIGSIDHVLPLAWAWNSYSLTVTPGAAADGKQLGIALMTASGNGNSWIHYDNVQLVPEPATMLIMGLGGLLIRRRK